MILLNLGGIGYLWLLWNWAFGNHKDGELPIIVFAVGIGILCLALSGRGLIYSLRHHRLRQNLLEPPLSSPQSVTENKTPRWLYRFGIRLTALPDITMAMLSFIAALILFGLPPLLTILGVLPRVLSCLTIPMFCGALYVAARFLYLARRRMVRSALDVRHRDERRPILLLRSFRDDNLKVKRALRGIVSSMTAYRVPMTLESCVAKFLWRFGPVVAIGRPGEDLPPLGAARQYVSGSANEWQSNVERMIEEAQLIVAVLGITEGLAWECRRAAEKNALKKLWILVPPGAPTEVEARWAGLQRILSSYRNLPPLDLLEGVECLACRFIDEFDVEYVICQYSDDESYETALAALHSRIGTI
jgi:hypothetical protein